MDVVLDGMIFSLQRAGGISTYWKELCHRLPKYADVHLFENKNANIARAGIAPNFRVESRLPVRLTRYSNFRARVGVNGIFHSSYYRVSTEPGLINLTTVHDFTYEKFGHSVARTVHSWQKGRAVSNSKGVICVSQNTKLDLLEYFPEFPEERVAVIHNGVGSEFSYQHGQHVSKLPGTKNLRQGNYVLFVGARVAYKNFASAVRAVSEIADLHLVAVGGGDILERERQMVQSLGDRFQHFSAISSAELNSLYNGAYCLLYPSSYEGFGIPVLEAMKSGCPVIAVNASSIPEVAGDAALLTTSADPKEFVSALRTLRNGEHRKRIVAAGLDRAAQFSWDRCAQETYSFYEKIWSLR
jgi:glycosyltransferase involved in cell wall biosynthesis